jgi:hypothetical protein
MNETKRPIITTSWDDGHTLDMRLADLLAAYGIRGTFYLPMQYPRVPLMSREQILKLRGMGMEIGSHTMTHPLLTRIPANLALQELRQSKQVLEDLLGEPVSSFCYPAGKFNRRTSALIHEARYLLARTTVSFRTDMNFDPFCMPVSFQFCPHPRQIHVRHELKGRNFKGLFDWCRLWKMENDLLGLSESMLEHVLRAGGILHVWGHSWEIEELGLWKLLEQVLKLIGNQPARYFTNSQVRENVEKRRRARDATISRSVAGKERVSEFETLFRNQEDRTARMPGVWRSSGAISS